MHYYEDLNLYLIKNDHYPMKTIVILFLFVFFAVNSYSQKITQNKDIIYLWPEIVPGEVKEKQAPVIDTAKNRIPKDNRLRFIEVTNPQITVWLPNPRINKRVAIIVCPGGGNKQLSYDMEGTDIVA